MATPVLQGLKEKYPHAHITFFVEQGFEDSIIQNPYCDELVLFNRQEIRDMLLRGQWKHGSQRFINDITALRKVPFDFLVNLSQHPYVSCLVSLLKTTQRVGRHFLRQGNDAIDDWWSQYLFAVPFARQYNGLHVSDIYKRIAGVEAKHLSYTVRLTEKERKDAQEFLSVHGFDQQKPIAVFQPGAAIPAKRWPPEHFIKLGQMLADSGWNILVSGAPSEKSVAAYIQQGIGKQSLSSAGSTTFRQAIALLSFARICITGDTALMHAAAAFPITVYALFGSTNPVETGPYRKDSYIFSAECNDRPCFNDSCMSMTCMKSISPQTVYAYINHGTALPESRCAVYKTGCDQQGDRYCKVLAPMKFLYYTKEGACITKNLFTKRIADLDMINRKELLFFIEESDRFIQIVNEMIQCLTHYLQTDDTKCISVFEQKKYALSTLSGINAFYTALLNIRLNSIPVLDPRSAVEASVEACVLTRTQIQTTLARIDNYAM